MPECFGLCRVDGLRRDRGPRQCPSTAVTIVSRWGRALLSLSAVAVPSDLSGTAVFSSRCGAARPGWTPTRPTEIRDGDDTPEDVRVLHSPDGEPTRELAGDARPAESFLEQTRGLMFRSSFPGDGLVFPFGSVKRRNAHMLFVRFPIDALWVADGEVTGVKRLDPWTGFASARADTLIELPAGTADAVQPGDSVIVES